MRIAPGIHINVSKSGLSLSAGPRGASVTFGRAGAYSNIGIPGTGIYARERLTPSGRKSRQSRGSSETIPDNVALTLQADGSVNVLDKDTDLPLHATDERSFKESAGDRIREWLSSECEKINAEVEALSRVHWQTPDPSFPPVYEPDDFVERPPAAPTLRSLPLLLRPMRWLFPGLKRRLASENEQRQVEYEAALADYERKRAEFEAKQLAKRRLIEEEILSDPDRMSDFLEACLLELDWPRETLVSHEIETVGELIRIDIDLPEIEDMPTRVASPHSRQYRVSIKELSSTRVQKLYAEHIHGVLFRIIGEAFHALPRAKQVVASGYSQRADPATGEIRNDYLLSIDVRREDWSRIDFGNLVHIDPVEALARFQLRRKMTRTGVFKPIEPW